MPSTYRCGVNLTIGRLPPASFCAQREFQSEVLNMLGQKNYVLHGETSEDVEQGL